MKNSRIIISTCALLAALATFLITSAVLADERKGGPSMALDAAGRTLRVHCNRGEKLTHALRRARSFDTIRFTGQCHETIVIRHDDLTLLGAANASIDGSQIPGEAVILVDGARNFSLSSFTVQNGSDQGILVARQATGRLQKLVVTGHGTVGLSVDRSHVEITDLSLDDNGTGGMDAYSASTVVAFGSISANGNGGDGLAVNGKTFLELRGAKLHAGQNAGSGVSVINDSRLQIFSFPEAQGSSIVADGNLFAGVSILGSELGVVGSQYFGSGANIIEARNSIFGFFMPAGAILSPHATARFVASNNGVGMLLEDGSSLLIVGGLDLSQNGTGISAYGAGTVTLVSVPPNPSSVDGNALDLDLGFGTRLTLDGVAYSTLACDGSPLVRGASCP
jgi:hypothetical protein